MYAIISSLSFEGLEELYGAPSLHVRDGDLHQALWQAARTELDFLLIDIDFSNRIVEELHQYRVQRPDTRIILIAIGREPGDQLVAKLVSIGVYDIISEPEETLINSLNHSIKTPASYTQAARWLQLGQPFNKYQPNKNVPEPTKEILIQQRPLGLTTIAVAGAGSGTGVSHLCIAIASYLARANNQVILAEWPISEGKAGTESQYAYLSSMGAKYECKKEPGIDIHIAHLDGFDIFLDGHTFRSIEYIFPIIAQKSYNYLVLDLGELSPEKVAELDRAALAILVVHASPYRWKWFLPIIDERELSFFVPNLARWKIALNLASEPEIKCFLDTFGKYIGKVYPIPYISHHTENHDFINEILQPVLPTNVVGHKRPFSILRAVLNR